MEGDSAQWKLPSYDDQHWEGQFPVSSNIYWWRVRVTLDERVIANNPLGLRINSFLGSYDAYWDGHYIGSNGTIGDSKKTEKAGGINRLFMLPQMLSQEGEHLLAVRVSQFYDTQHQTYPFLKLSNYDQQSQTLILLAAFMHIFAGVFFVVAIYYFFLYQASFRQATFLIFGLLSFTLFAWMILEYVWFYYAYPYPFHFIRLDLIAALVFINLGLMSAFFLYRFSVPYGKWILLTQLVIQLFIMVMESDYDKSTFYEVNLSLLVSIGILGWAIYRQKAFALESLLSILPLLLTDLFFYPIYYDQTLFTAFIFFMLTNLYILSKSVGELRLQLESTRQRTQLLQIELLKKNIQPHFLMNTLTSLISWVEESPTSAVKFIEALAEEFENLRGVAERTLIPIEEEIALCRAHLRVMQFRNEIPYTLTTENIREEEMVPPGLFLTVLENGLTHNQIGKEHARFSLTFHQEENIKSYTFISPGEPVKETNEMVERTGMKYIHARLQESYHDRWTVLSQRVPRGWKTEISIKVK